MSARKAYSAAYYRANKENWKGYGQTYRSKARPAILHAQRRWAYGILAKEYEELLATQGGVCASCRKPETLTRKGVVQSLSVDHNHETRAIRGLLCNRCNVALGLLGDDIERVKMLHDYLLEQT